MRKYIPFYVHCPSADDMINAGECIGCPFQIDLDDAVVTCSYEGDK